MGVKVSYAEITKRVAAYIVDQMIFLSCYSLFFSLILFILPGELTAKVFSYLFPDDTDTYLISERYEILKNLDVLLLNILLEDLVYIVLEVLMITRLGRTPGKLLFDIYIKDANTLKNAALMQVVMRSTLKALLFVPLYISEWFLILPILILIPAAFDQRKQLFYDKIAETVVMDYKPEECHLNLNYVGITRRVIAHIVDRLVIMGISLVCLVPVGMIFHIAGSKLFITRGYLSFLLSIVFGVFMIRRSGGTPGQLLCGIHIKDANTLENITLVQAIIRYASFEVINLPILITGKKFKYIFEWWLEHLPGEISIIMILIIFICAIFDRRKQFLHDKIAKTVAVKKKAEVIVINKPTG